MISLRQTKLNIQHPTSNIQHPTFVWLILKNQQNQNQSQGQNTKMKGVPHYLKDGTLHKGGSHKMPNGDVHTGKSHSASSQKLFHFDDLSKTAQKKAKGAKGAKSSGAKMLRKKIVSKKSGYGY